jgi:hypothetical protein
VEWCRYHIVANLLEKYIGLCDLSGDQEGLIRALILKGNIYLKTKKAKEALAIFTRVLPYLVGTGNTRDVIRALEGVEGVAVAYADTGNLSGALKLVCAADTIRDLIGFVPSPTTRERTQATTVLVRQQLSKAEADAACGEGAGMTIEQAVEYALGSSTFPSPVLPDR